MCILLAFTGVLISASSKPFAGTKLTILTASDGLENARITSPYIPSFEEETGIKVDFIELSQSNLHTRLATIFAAKSPDVDLLWTWAGWTSEFASANYLEDLTNYLSKEEWDEFVPGALDAVKYGNKYFGIPRFYSIRHFYYNKQLFREAGLDPNKPPTNWDEFIEYAQKIADPKANKWGVLHDYGSNDSLLINFQEHLILVGGRITDENNNITFNDEKGIEALERIIELNRLGLVDPASYGIGEGPVKRSRWIQGRNGMEWGWAADYFASNSNESKIKGEVGVAIIPAINTSGAITGSEGYAISKFSKNKQAALEFLKYITRDEIQKDMAMRTGWYPVKKSVLEDPELVNSSPLFKVAAEQSKYPTYRFAAPFNAELTDILGPELLAAINGEKSAKQALDDAAAALQPIIQAYK